MGKKSTLPRNDTGGGADKLPTAKQAMQNPHGIGTEEYYLFELDRLDKRVRGEVQPSIQAINAQRLGGYWEDQARRHGIDIAAAHRSRMDPLHRFLQKCDLMEMQEQDLEIVAAAMKEVDSLNPDLVDVKKKWLILIARAIELQKVAKAGARRGDAVGVAKMIIYVMRSQEDDSGSSD